MARWASVFGVLLLGVGCAGPPPGVGPFYANDLPTAAKQLEAAAANVDKNYAMYACNLGMVYLTAGEFDKAGTTFENATYVMNDLEAGQARGLGSLIGSESTKIFKGEPFERAMASFYSGLVRYLYGDYDNARAGFLQALQADRDSDDEYQEDFALAYYWFAKVSERRGDSQDAELALSKARERWARNAYLDHGSLRAANLTVLIDLGRTPAKVVTGPEASLDEFEPAQYPERSVNGYVDGRSVGRSAPLIDLYFQAKTRGRSAKDTIQIAKGIARFAAMVLAMVSRDRNTRIGALAFALLYPSYADTRQCQLLPGEAHVLTASVPPGRHELRLEFVGKGGVPLPSFQQSCTFEAESKRETIVYVRSGPNRVPRVVAVPLSERVATASAHDTSENQTAQEGGQQ